MNPKDQALLTLMGAALIPALLCFPYVRWIRGQSVSLSTFFAALAYGGTIALAFLVAYETFAVTRPGMGLERLLAPFIIAFFSLVGATIIALIIYIFGNRKRAKLKALSPEAQAIIREASGKP